MRHVLILLLCLNVVWGSAAAEGLFNQFPSEPGGTVTEVVDGDTVFLSSGAEVRMVGIQAPKLPLGRRNFRKWPLADEAAETLASLTTGREFRMVYGGARMDRHGRALAHLVGDGDFWLQGEMLRLGLARVYTFPDNVALAEEMLARERAARAGQFGIWSHPFYAIRQATMLSRQDINTFQLVEGQIRAVATVRGTTYLNFGDDWRTDFTIAIRSKARKRFSEYDFSTWEGQNVRVRGWLKSRNGPMIEATHPEQIERLE